MTRFPIKLQDKRARQGSRRGQLVEAFRKADLIDLSLGIISYGVSHRDILDLYQTFPESNFHVFILGEVFKNTLKNPFNPLPIFKW